MKRHVARVPTTGRVARGGPEMTTNLMATAVVLTPLLGVAVWLWLSNRWQVRREERIARQIALTDAIHRELGAVAAPTVTGSRGAWRVRMRAPLDRPALLSTLVRITEREFARRDGERSGLCEITLTPAPRETEWIGPDMTRPALDQAGRLAA